MPRLIDRTSLRSSLCGLVPSVVDDREPNCWNIRAGNVTIPPKTEKRVEF